jgi:predicted HicB family RNase H-like nuclease
MTMESVPSNRSVVFLRCPEELREQLAAAARQSLRSLNSEAVYRLQQSLKQTAVNEAAA